jgi:competence protein ComEA
MRQHAYSLLIGVFSGLLAAGLVLLFIAKPKRYPIQLLPPPTPSPIRIHITGAVARPGVYNIAQDAIWKTALDVAGGSLDNADLERINLAAPLADGQHIFVPYQSADPSSIPTSPLPVLNDLNLLDINHATLAELEQLPGIGPSLAKSIITYREEHGFFLKPEDLLLVSGIGPAKLEKIIDLIRCQ